MYTNIWSCIITVTCTLHGSFCTNLSVHLTRHEIARNIINTDINL